MTDRTDRLLEAVAKTLGFRLLTRRTLQVEANGDGFTTGHELTLEGPDGIRRTQLVYLESHPSGEPREGVLRLRDPRDGTEVDAWLYPKDPALPALEKVVYADTATEVLRRLGFSGEGLQVSLAAYRPGTRAVVRLAWTDRTLFLKVVVPEVAAPLHARHGAWRSQGIPVPPSLGWSEEGLVALQGMPGVEAITAAESLSAPEAFLDAVESLCARIAAVHSTSRARPSLISRLDWYERRVGGIAPERVAALCRSIEAHRERGGEAPPVTVHGDLHLGQLLVDPLEPSRITGVLDIDTAGVGDPADDAAALYAHLVASAVFHASGGRDAAAAQCDDLAARWLSRWHREGDPGFGERARAIAATHLLGHSLTNAGPAEWMLGRAEALLEPAHASPITGPRHAAG